jgi:hypothetical protein
MESDNFFYFKHDDKENNQKIRFIAKKENRGKRDSQILFYHLCKEKTKKEYYFNNFYKNNASELTEIRTYFDDFETKKLNNVLFIFFFFFFFFFFFLKKKKPIPLIFFSSTTIISTRSFRAGADIMFYL